MPEENTTMEEQTTGIETEDDEEVGGIPGKMIAFAIGVVGGGLLLLKRKFGKKKYAVIDHGRFGRDAK